MTDDYKQLDASNISILYVYLSEGYDSYIEWFKEQKPERQEYVLELMGNMIAELINSKSECSKIFNDSGKPLAEVLQFKQRKPTLTVVK